jgi:hypothetical protein
MASGKGIKERVIVDQMNLIDEGPTIARLLGVELKKADGRIVQEFLT